MTVATVVSTAALAAKQGGWQLDDDSAFATASAFGEIACRMFIYLSFMQGQANSQLLPVYEVPLSHAALFRV